MSTKTLGRGWCPWWVVLPGGQASRGDRRGDLLHTHWESEEPQPPAQSSEPRLMAPGAGTVVRAQAQGPEQEAASRPPQAALTRSAGLPPPCPLHSLRLRLAGGSRHQSREGHLVTDDLLSWPRSQRRAVPAPEGRLPLLQGGHPRTGGCPLTQGFRTRSQPPGPSAARGGCPTRVSVERQALSGTSGPSCLGSLGERRQGGMEMTL